MEVQMVNVEKDRLRGLTFTWWKFLQDEKDKKGKNPISTWKEMMEKIKEAYVLENYEIQLHKKRKTLEEKDLDVNSYTEEFQKVCIRSQVVKDEN